MKIAVLGGSFNPLHVSHAMLADTVIKELGYDKVLFVPTYIPPHKVINSNITPEQRLEMLERFCREEGDGHFEVESCEIERGGVSYTVDTLVYLQEKYKSELDGKFALLMGDEIAAEFNHWVKPEKIVELADLIITKRYPDWASLQKTDFNNVHKGKYSDDYQAGFDFDSFEYKKNSIYLEKPLLPVSSTEIRMRAAQGKSYKYLVPKSIYEYIEKNELYRAD